MNMSILRRTSPLLLVNALLLVTAQRLPAPIVETPEPTATARPKAKSKPPPKPKESSADAERTKSTKLAVEKLANPRASRSFIGGTWAGTLSTTAAGNFEFTLVINSTGTVIKETSSNFGTVTHTGVWDGKTGKWHSGPSNVYSWSFTPNPDGKTAMATVTGPYVANPLTAFRKISP